MLMDASFCISKATPEGTDSPSITPDPIQFHPSHIHLLSHSYMQLNVPVSTNMPVNTHLTKPPSCFTVWMLDS